VLDGIGDQDAVDRVVDGDAMWIRLG